MSMPDEKHRLSFPHLEGMYGYVTVEGVPVEVYGSKIEGTKAVGYIEAVEGKAFEVAFFDGRGAPPDPHTMRVFLDGARVTGMLFRTTAAKYTAPMNSPLRIERFTGAEVTVDTIAPFLSTKLTATDDDDEACTSKKVVSGMGSIQLRYHRVKGVREVTASTFTGPKQQRIHEKSKKATLSHQAGFGAPVSCVNNGRLTYDWIDDASAPYAIVELRYRSRALLQLDGLIPDSPAGSPAASASASPSPQPAPQIQAPSPSPVAGPSKPRRSPSAEAPAASASTSRLSQLEAELEELKRNQRIAALEREIAELRNGGGASGSQSPSASQAKKRGAADGLEHDLEDLKRVKKEKGEEMEKKKAKDRRKGRASEVIDLCDSDSDRGVGGSVRVSGVGVVAARPFFSLSFLSKRR